MSMFCIMEWAALIQPAELHISDCEDTDWLFNWETLFPIDIDNTTARAATSNATTTNNIFSNRVRLPQAEFENVGPLWKENKINKL